MLALAVAAAASVAGATVTYRWTDTDGVHYSDQPHPGAEKVYLGQTQTYSSAESAAAPIASVGTRRAREAGNGPFHYDSCAVVQPAEDQVLIDVDIGNDHGAAAAAQAQQRSPGAEFRRPGRSSRRAPSSRNSRSRPIDRGTHTVAATIRDADGNNLCQSAAVSFHVRQASALAPQNPNRKH